MYKISGGNEDAFLCVVEDRLAWVGLLGTVVDRWTLVDRWTILLSAVL